MEQFSNRDVADILSETAKLMELHNVNEFKLRSLQNAAFVISRLDTPVARLQQGEMEQIKGIGKSISLKIHQILETGSLPELDTYLNDTPKGVIDMMHIKGIGPKKVAVLWKQLGVESPGELLYACNENRLVELKGFGSKTQDQIRKSIEYSISSKGLFHYAALEHIALELIEQLRISKIFSRVELTGAIRRKCELLKDIEIIAAITSPEGIASRLSKMDFLKQFDITEKEQTLSINGPEGVSILIYLVNDEGFISNYFLRTASEAHLEQLQSLQGFDNIKRTVFKNENEIYASLGLSYIEPELREGIDEIELARDKKLPRLIEFSDLKGILHNHSTYSDGQHSLREMAIACKNSGYEYLGICDHSKSAFYANGMSEERIVLQHAEIDELNKELAPFKIFKGIESDILNDGSLDYPEHVLKQFDFIVASVHSGLKMTVEKATERLLKAIANPYTTILGHPTGRLLLAREGYPIDHKKVIDACAKYHVVLELNAHPYRLDIDWRWIRYAISKNVMISINPDAHQVSAYHDMYYGVCVARKGCLTKEMTFNALSLEQVRERFSDKLKG